MGRKLKFTKEEILDKAYEILVHEGMKKISARVIAKELGISTIGVYSNFSSMSELKNELSVLAKNKLFDKVKINYTELGLLNIGIGICLFAKEEKDLFRAIFMRENLSKEFLDEITNDLVGLVYKSFKENEKYKDLKDSTIDWLIRRGWWSTHGFACLICSGFYNPTYEVIEKELREVGGLIMREALKMDKLPENQLEKNLNIKLLRGEE